MGILHIPYDNISTVVPLHLICNLIKWEITHINIREFITSNPLGTDQIRATSIPGAKKKTNSHTYPVRMWGLSLFKIASLGSILYGTKWLFRRPHVQNPAEEIIKRGSTIDHCRSRCKGREGPPLIHSFVCTLHIHNSGLQAITALSLIYTPRTSPLHTH
jgi:hypothetical protein